MPVVSNRYSIQAGILADLKDFWSAQLPVFRKQQERMLRYLPESNIRNITEVWKESTPFPAYWPYGKGRTIQNFKDVYFSLGKYNYELSVAWSRFDEEDDQLGDLRQKVQMATKRFGMLPDVLISEYLNNSASMNPSILNAYDGAALISATDGDGAARFGVTGGNLLTGSGNTPDGVIHDLNVVQRRLSDAVDPTAARPVFAPDEVDFSKFLCVVPNELNEVFRKTAESEYLKIDGGNVVSESNWMKGRFEWETNPYLTDSSDWFVILQHPYWKPFMYREPKSPETVIADMSNSDSARDTGEYRMHAHVRTALGPFMPLTIFKVNN